MYNETANDIFEKQMKNLSEMQPKYNEIDYSEPEPDFTIEDPEKERTAGLMKTHPNRKFGKNATIYTQDLQELAL